MSTRNIPNAKLFVDVVSVCWVVHTCPDTKKTYKIYFLRGEDPAHKGTLVYRLDTDHEGTPYWSKCEDNKWFLADVLQDIVIDPKNKPTYLRECEYPVTSIEA